MGRQQELTAKQQRIYDYLRQTILEKGFPPSVREICAEVGLSSSSTVHSHLSALAEKGFIRRDPSKPRAIEIVDQSFTPRREPVCDRYGGGRLQPENDEMEPMIAGHAQICRRAIGLLRFMG